MHRIGSGAEKDCSCSISPEPVRVHDGTFRRSSGMKGNPLTLAEFYSTTCARSGDGGIRSEYGENVTLILRSRWIKDGRMGHEPRRTGLSALRVFRVFLTTTVEFDDSEGGETFENPCVLRASDSAFWERNLQ
jgi:hypothetical protein